jgi:hypothetical protein
MKRPIAGSYHPRAGCKPMHRKSVTTSEPHCAPSTVQPVSGTNLVRVFSRVFSQRGRLLVVSHFAGGQRPHGRLLRTNGRKRPRDVPPELYQRHARLEREEVAIYIEVAHLRCSQSFGVASRPAVREFGTRS